MVTTPKYSDISTYHRQCLPATNYWREQNGLPLIDVPESDENYKQYFKTCIEPSNKVIVIRPTFPTFTYFKAPIKNAIPYRNVTLALVHKVVSDPKYFKDRTDRIRSMVYDSPEQRNYKLTAFDYVTFSGVFAYRKNDSLVNHSGLLSFDFDKIDAATLRTRILSDENIETALLFCSPRGGIKWVTPIDITAGTHLEYFKAFQSYFSDNYNIEVGLDQGCKEVSRACFLSYDPDAFIHPKYKAV